MRSFQIVLFAALLTFAFSQSAEAKKPDIQEMNLCQLLLDSAKPASGLDLSDVIINPTRGSSAQTLFQRPAQDGLVHLVEWDNGRGYQLAVQLLLDLGLIKANKDDRFYTPLRLLADNQSFSIRRGMNDAAAAKFLKNNFGRKVKLGVVSDKISPAPESKRHVLFLSYFVEAVAQLNSSRTLSQKKAAIDAVELQLMEVERLFLRHYQSHEKTKEEVDQVLEKPLKMVLTPGFFLPKRRRGLPHIVRSLIGEIPFADPAMDGIALGYRWLFERNLEGSRQSLPSNRDYRGLELEPNTRFPYVADTDIYDYRQRTRSFLKKHLRGLNVGIENWESPELFTPAFATEIRDSFWELNLIRQSAIRNRFGAEGASDLSGAFGDMSFESYKSIGRSALVTAVLNGESKYFSLPAGRVEKLRDDMIADLEFGTKENLDIDKVDTFYVFLQLDALGRGSDDFIEFLDDIHQISRRVGTDYERRTLAIVEHYPYASYSFIRLPEVEREKIIRCFKLIYRYNAGQVILAEGGFNSLRPLEGQAKGDLAFLYYRSLFSYAAIPSSPELPGTKRLTDTMLERWEFTKNILYYLSIPGNKSENGFHSYLSWMADKMRLPIPTVPRPTYESGRTQITVAKLAIQSNHLEPNEADQVRDAFDDHEISDAERATLVRFHNDYNDLTYFSWELYRAIDETAESKGTRESNPKYSLKLWMKLLARIYQRVESDDRFFRLNSAAPEKGDVRINVHDFIPYVKSQTRSNESALSVTFQIELRDSAFEVQISEH